jgi:hypothetical protein
MITLPDLNDDDVLCRTDDRIPGIVLSSDEVLGKFRWVAECLETGLVGIAKTPHEAVEDLERSRNEGLVTSV